MEDRYHIKYTQNRALSSRNQKKSGKMFPPALSRMRENNIEVVGVNENGESIDVCIDMDDVVSCTPTAQ